jgi:hypothetical protein
MESKIIFHQKDLDVAFQWIEFAYQQGNALLEAGKRRLADFALFKHVPTGSCYTSSRSSFDRYVWLDVDLYLPDTENLIQKIIFVALSYASDENEGCYFIVGTCDLKDDGGYLLKKPTHGHWLIDYSVNPTYYPKKFEIVERTDGLAQFIPGEALEPAYRDGVKQILSASFPVSWIDTESRLSAIIKGLVDLYKNDETQELSYLLKEAEEFLK